ncbi:YihY/virulence factor BrkB family protein [Changchengzhania lutea]|uniref:YihY/virulence factor BrkB family protein n=1 Tax=Changchengzhania lutea TaxID=2049305 RepID=UPI00115D79EF|nr:YihY/virulence factor BrkB family protein [Changchengzhania lutea]
MYDNVERFLKKIPIVNKIVAFLKRIKPRAFQGLSVYDLLELYTLGIVRGAVSIRASAIAFSLFISIFPFLLFILKVIPYIPGDKFKSQFQSFLESFLPPNTAEFFFENIFQNISSTVDSNTISYIFILSLLLMTSAVASVFSGFQNSYHEQLSRNILAKYTHAFGVAIILAFILILTVAVLGYFQIYIVHNLERSGLIDEYYGAIWTKIGKFVFVSIMIYMASATLYYFGTKEGKHSRFFSTGALFTTILVLITTYLFGIYIEYFARYNELYGSIGALLILLLSFWLNANILLLGYELNVAMNRIKRKSTSSKK